MKEYDYVKLTIEKEKYARYGVHKNMDGWICDPRIIEGNRLVSFENEDGSEIACIAVKIEDLEVIAEAPIKKIGSHVLLFNEDYQQLGLQRGLKGVLLNLLDNGKWLVRFDVQEGLAQALEVEIDDCKVALDPDFNN